MQGIKRYKVSLLPHDAMWEVEFSKVKEQIQGLRQDNVIDIQHFGSTAINNVCAKPILDVAVVLKSFADMNIKAMTTIGYDYCGVQIVSAYKIVQLSTLSIGIKSRGILLLSQ